MLGDTTTPLEDVIGLSVENVGANGVMVYDADEEYSGSVTTTSYST
jgi:hypothetical protein